MMPRPHSRPRLAADAPSLLHNLALSAIAAGGVVLLTAIVARLGADEHWPLDHDIRATLALHGLPRMRATLKAVGSAGTVWVYLPATIGVMVLVARRHGHPRRVIPLASSTTAAALASLLLKQLVRRPRPRPASGLFNEKPSFPSGHATRASAAALAIAYVLVRERMAPREVAIPLAIALAGAVGVSRAYADAHWTTDVLGGWALGGASAAMSGIWYEKIRAET